jgi:hypothetical protein
MANKNTIPENKHFTYKDVAKKNNVSTLALSKRTHKLGIIGKRIGPDGSLYFTEKQINKILAFKREDFKNHSRKITIVEMYHDGHKGKRIAAALGISLKLTYLCLKEYNQTEHIVVQSKMNKL